MTPRTMNVLLSVVFVMLWLLGCEAPSTGPGPLPSAMPTVTPSNSPLLSAFPTNTTPTGAPQPTASRVASPTAIPTSAPPYGQELPLAFSTSQGLFIWSPKSGERKRISTVPVARLSWEPAATSLAVTYGPFTGIRLGIVMPFGPTLTHQLTSDFAFPVWMGNGKDVLALPCPGTSGRLGDFQAIDPVSGSARIVSTAEVWSWLPNVAPDLTKALILPFNAPYSPAALVVFDDWQRAPLLMSDVQFPNCPDAYAWSPDSRYLAYYSGGRFWVRDFSEREPQGKVIGGAISVDPINVAAPALAWSPDGTQLALALKGQLWIADLRNLSARRMDGFSGIFSGLSWASTPRRLKLQPDGVLARLLPYLNPADFYVALVESGNRASPRIIATSSDVVSSLAPFVYLDYAGRKLHMAPPAARLHCPTPRLERPQAPALRLSSEQLDNDGREILLVTGGWYMAMCRGTLIYRWDGSQLSLQLETSAAAPEGK